MVSEATRDEIFVKMREDVENLRCFDCDASNPLWAEVTFGVFICEACAGAHRDLGISLVRSLQFDIWNVSQLKVLTAGGNRSCQSFFSAYGIQRGAPAAFKYKTKAAQYYAHLLAAVAEGMPCTMPAPPIDQGMQPAEVVTSAEGLYPSLEPQPVGEAKGRMGEVRDLMKKAVSKGEEIGSKVLDKINEVGRHPKVKRVEDKTVEVLTAVETKLREGTNRIAQTEAFQSAKEKATQVAHRVGESAAYQKAKGAAGSAVQKLQDLYDRFWHNPPAPVSQ